MYRFAVAVKVLVRELDGFGAVGVLDFVMDGSSYICRQFPQDHFLD